MKNYGMKNFARDVLRGTFNAILIVSFVLACLATVYILDTVIVFLWNYVVPEILGLPELHQFQGSAIWLLISILRGKLGDGIESATNQIKAMKAESNMEIDKMLSSDSDFGVFRSGKKEIPKLKAPEQTDQD